MILTALDQLDLFTSGMAAQRALMSGQVRRPSGRTSYRKSRKKQNQIEKELP